MHFKPLKLKAANIFGVKVSGTVGRSDRHRLQELHAKCLEHDKTNLVLDFSGLNTIGGSGAMILADFQQQLIANGGEAVFVGAGDVVRHFLDQKFQDLPLRYFFSVDDAVEGFSAQQASGPSGNESGPDAAEDTTAELPERDRLDDGQTDDVVGAVCVSSEEANDAGLDSLLDSYEVEEADQPQETEPEPQSKEPVAEPAAETAAEPATEPAGKSVKKPAAKQKKTPGSDPASGDKRNTGKKAKSEAGKKPVPAHHFISFDEAVAALDEAQTAEVFGEVLSNLLHSYGLADDVTYFYRNAKGFVTSKSEVQFPGDGAFARCLFETERPLSMLDIRDDDLSDDETQALAGCIPDLIVPVIKADTLRGFAFLQREQSDHEYEVSENFALEMVMRLLARPEPVPETDIAAVPDTDPEQSDPDQSELEQDLASPLSVSEQTLLVSMKLATDLAATENDEHFWKVFSTRLSAIAEVESVVFFNPEDKNQRRICQGQNKKKLEKLDLTHEKLTVFLRTLERPVEVQNLPVSFKTEKAKMKKLGIQWILGLKAETRFQGAVLLGFAEDVIDDLGVDSLSMVLDVTAKALNLVQHQRRDADLALDLVRTLVAQDEIRREGSDEQTRILVDQVRCLAREVGFPLDQERDLIFGALLRDIGLLAHHQQRAADKGQEMSKGELLRYRKHPQIGADLLESLQVSSTIRDVVLSHHERFGGSGYPNQLQGREIPLAARIVAVVEHYVTLISGENDNLQTPEAAAETMRENADEQFDPDIIAIFLQAIDNSQIAV